MNKQSIHEKAGLIRDGVFSANDGIVTTFAIIAGAAGANLSSNIVLILGFANLFGDGISMAVGNYLGVKSEKEYEEAQGDKRDEKRDGNPVLHGAVSFIAFNIAGLIPMIPFVFKVEPSFTISTILVGVAFFFVGFLKSFYTRKNMIKSGLEVFLVGSFASFVAFAIGFLVDKYIV